MDDYESNFPSRSPHSRWDSQSTGSSSEDSLPVGRRGACREKALSSVVLLAAFPLVAACLVALGLSSAEAESPETPVLTEAQLSSSAAGWLATQMVDGDHFETVFGDTAYPDQGLTIDALLGFAAAGSAGDAAGRAMDWLSQPGTVSGYIGDGVNDSYAGATAKLALAAQVSGVDPTAVGGVDLIARLTALEDASGHFADASAWGDYSNTIGQSLAVIVLSRHPGSGPSAASLDFLEAAQCPDGGFGLELAPQPESCSSGVDTTAFAMQALLSAGRADAVADAVAYLLSAQQVGGGFATAGSGTPNANSTGLAAQALGMAGRTSEASSAQAFIQTLFQGCDSPLDDRGAIAFDASGFDPVAATRATPQAILGLSTQSLVDLSIEGAAPGIATLDCRGVPNTTAGGPTSTTSATPTSAPPDSSGGPVPQPTPIPRQPDYAG